MVARTEKTEALLQVLERGVKMSLSDKFMDISLETERDIELEATEITIIGRALGEVLDSFEYPLYWRRFLERKDCPQYMKKVVTQTVQAYYPKLSLPEESNWVTF